MNLTKRLALWALLAAFPSFANAQPADNPLADAYGTAYPWTDDLAWENVHVVTDAAYGAVADDGLSDQAAFAAAIDAASTDGGGVVYAPAGTYHFDDHLVLKDGVILRGATPPPANASIMWTRDGEDLPLGTRADGTFLDAPAQHADYDPPTNLVFPKYVPVKSGNGTPNDSAFKVITVEDEIHDSNWGLVNLDINHARIRNFVNDRPNGVFEYTNDAVDTTQQRNIVLFGLRGNHMVRPAPDVPKDDMVGWHRFPDRGSAHISLLGYENILVANCRLNDNITENFYLENYVLPNGNPIPGVDLSADPGAAEFRYTDVYGININRNQVRAGPPKGYTPDTVPGGFRRGIVIRDNWMYHTARVAYYASGQDMVMKDNIKVDQPGKSTAIHPTGNRQVAGFDTLENRGIDFSGFDVTVEGNYLMVYSHKVYTSNAGVMDGAVDGESILHQEFSGSLVRRVRILNNHVRGYLSLFKSQDIEDAIVNDNLIIDHSNPRKPEPAIFFISADTNVEARHYLKDVEVLGNSLDNPSAGDRWKYVIRGSGGIDNVVFGDPQGTASVAELTEGIQTQNVPYSVTRLPLDPDATYDPLPEVVVTAPADGSIVPGESVTVTASATDEDGVEKVEFWSDGQLLGEDSTAPYELTLTGLGDGDRFNVFAKAVEADNPSDPDYSNNREAWSHQSVHFAYGSLPVVIPEGVTITPVSGSDLSLTFATENGQTYTVERSTTGLDANSANWTAVGSSISGDGNEATVTDTGILNAQDRVFYRIVVNQ